MTTRSPLLTVGGKFASAERIVAAFPPPHCYDRYVAELHQLYPEDRWRRMTWTQKKASMNYSPTRGGLFDD
jgi:hypothetical protein